MYSLRTVQNSEKKMKKKKTNKTKGNNIGRNIVTWMCMLSFYVCTKPWRCRVIICTVHKVANGWVSRTPHCVRT